MNFALISEGVTDRPIVEALLVCYFAKYHPHIYPNLNHLQPKAKEPGGWTLVFNYCSTNEFKGAFQLNEYVIIQIDTDRHQDPGFEINEFTSTEDLIEKVKQKIIKKIGVEFYEIHKNKIIFAISVHSIECWLVPFYAATKAHAQKEINCCATVNFYLSKHHGYTIDCNKHEDSYSYFFKASALLAKHRYVFPSAYEANLSLKYFIEKELTKISPPRKDEVEEEEVE